MIIALDMDDVICDLLPEWLNRYNKDHNDCLTKDDIKSWAMGDYTKCGIAIYDYLKDPTLYQVATPINEAYNVTRQWLDNGFEIVIVTRVHNACAAAEKIKWLQIYFPHLENIIILTTDQKHLINADILIDDGAHNLEHFKGLRILMTRPWNKSISIPYIRVENWFDLNLAVLTLSQFIQQHDLRLYHETGCNLLLKRLHDLKKDEHVQQLTSYLSEQIKSI